MNWKSANIEQVKQIVERELTDCNPGQRILFETYCVQPRLALLERSGNREPVVVVAQRGNEVIYWEDVEEGFEVSPIDSDGLILNPGCNQNDLRFALDAWSK